MSYFFHESSLIKGLRKLHGFSQSEFCKLLGYSQSALSKIENGLLSPDMKFVIGLSQKIDLDLNCFRLGFVPHVPEYLLAPGRSQSFLRQEFLEEGFLSAKTAHQLLSQIQKNTDEDIFEKCGLTEEHFIFSQLKYNLPFLVKVLTHVSLKDLIFVIESFKLKTFGARPDNQEIQFFCQQYQHFLGLKNVLHHKDKTELEFSLHQSLTQIHELIPKFLPYVLSLDLLIQFNVQTTNVKRDSKTLNFTLDMYAA
jgi:transcriptional regulator with XRE-family HTH domain